MRYVNILLGMVIVLLLFACSSETQADEPDQETPVEQEKQKEPGQEQEKDENQPEQTKEDKDSENEKTQDDVEKEEDPTPPEGNIKPQYEIKDNWYFKPIGEAEPKAVLLTIDDAPDQYALEMAKTLNELDVPAIFFVNGIFVQSEEEKEILKQIHELGFAIGNHTYGHTQLSNVSQKKQKEEILKLNLMIEDITGEKPKFFRAPHGDNTDFANQLVKEEGMLLMNWSFGYDFLEGYMEEEALIDITLNTNLLGKGANILMHDREWTLKALPEIVKGLRDQGYSFIDPASIKTP